MGKPTKNDTGSGGDERNAHERKCKTAGIPAKASSSLVKRLGESESSSRVSKPSGNTGNKHLTAGKSVTNLRSPLKRDGLGQPANRVSNRLSTVSTNKEVKKPNEAAKAKGPTAKMKPESETLERKPKPAENQESSSQVETVKQSKDANVHADEQPASQHKNGVNGEEATSDNAAAVAGENGTKENGKAEQNGDASSPSERDEEFNLRLETDEQSAAKPAEESEPKEPPVDEAKIKDEPSELKPTDEEPKEEEPQTDTESCSVDVVESTTSELSEATESTAPSEAKDGESQDAGNESGSCDASKAQRSCSVQLTDCLRDPQTEEGDSAQQSQSHSKKDFFESIRKVSGRRSIGRMRSESAWQSSPNSSLYVNISTDEAGPANRSDYYHSLLSDSASNGRTPSTEERKRKLPFDSQREEKKIKTLEESGSCALEHRRAESASTSADSQSPSSQSIRRDVSADSNSSIWDSSSKVKKWCSIM